MVRDVIDAEATLIELDPYIPVGVPISHKRALPIPHYERLSTILKGMPLEDAAETYPEIARLLEALQLARVPRSDEADTSMTDPSERVLVQLRVRPRSRKGWRRDADGGLILGVASAPAEGAANDEARRTLAEALGVAPTRVTLHRGARSREKIFAVSGLDVAAVRKRLEALERSMTQDLR